MVPSLFRILLQILRDEHCDSCKHWDMGSTSKDGAPMCCKLTQEHVHGIDWCENWKKENRCSS